MNCNIKH